MFKSGSKVIAEIGQNHNGSLSSAKKLVDLAYSTNCYSAKLVKRDPNSFPDQWKRLPYNNDNSFGKTYYDHRVALELSDNDFIELADYIKSSKLVFGSSFTDKASLEFLIDIDVDYLKIASSRVIDTDLLKLVADKKKPVILSTGMSEIEWVEKALYILRNCPYIAILQCTSCYPSLLKDLYLNVLHTYRKYNRPVGLSTHNVWFYSALMARAIGAEWFEFHITLDRKMKGTDQCFSLEEYELSTLNYLLSEADEALGDFEKSMLKNEVPYATKLRSDLPKS